MSVWSGNGMQFLDVHFLDVGHGDCTIVEFPERLTVVDINNGKAFDKEIETEFQHRYKPAPANPFLAGGLSALAGGTAPPVPSPLLSPSYAGAFGGLGGGPTPLSSLLTSLLSQKTEAEKKRKRQIQTVCTVCE